MVLKRVVGEIVPELVSDALYAGTYFQSTKRLWPALPNHWPLLMGVATMSWLHQAGALVPCLVKAIYASGEAQWQKLLLDGRVGRYWLRHSPVG